MLGEWLDFAVFTIILLTTQSAAEIQRHLGRRLTYNYELGNKNNHLKNAGDEKNVSDYVVRSTGDYAYDANGNMTADPGKGTTIIYNYLNLPECVSFTNNKGKLFYHFECLPMLSMTEATKVYYIA